MELDDNLFNKKSEKGYNEESIYILHYPNSSISSVSFGYGIEAYNELYISHKCNTEKGSSGGPILNLSTNKVIGIHKAFINSKQFNIGTLLKYPINLLKEKNFPSIPNNNDYQNKNVIKGILDIKSNEINNKIILFNSDINNGIDVYLNNKKINMIKEDKKWIIDYNFQKEGIYQFEIVFNNIINNMNRFFQECSNIISLDFSKFNSSNVTNMENLFSECIRLKEIKGLNNLITNKVLIFFN